MDQLSRCNGLHLYALCDFELVSGKTNKKMLKLLETKGGDYSISSRIGLFPVHSAIENDSILVLAYLYYEKKIDFEVKTKQGLTPFLFAIRIK
jgi:hypothetical protein